MKSEEAARTRVTVRVPEDLLDDYDEALEAREANRSEDIRRYMRSVVEAPEEGEQREPPKDDDLLATGYKALREAAGGRPLPIGEAQSVVSSKTNIPAESVARRILKPLHERGYLARKGDPINDPWIRVR